MVVVSLPLPPTAGEEQLTPQILTQTHLAAQPLSTEHQSSHQFSLEKHTTRIPPRKVRRTRGFRFSHVMNREDLRPHPGEAEVYEHARSLPLPRRVTSIKHYFKKR